MNKIILSQDDQNVVVTIPKEKFAALLEVLDMIKQVQQLDSTLQSGGIVNKETPDEGGAQENNDTSSKRRKNISRGYRVNPRTA